MSSKKPQIWTYPVFYLGGYSSSQRIRNGTLSITESNLAFESYTLKIKIPLTKILFAKINVEKGVDRSAVMAFGVIALLADVEEKVLTICFEDDSSVRHQPRFQFIVKSKLEYETLPEQAMANINSLMPETVKISCTNQTQPVPMVQELKEFFCKYCGSKNDADANYCQSCGKNLKIQKEVACSICGISNAARAVFCKNCGNKLAKQ